MGKRAFQEARSAEFLGGSLWSRSQGSSVSYHNALLTSLAHFTLSPDSQASGFYFWNKMLVPWSMLHALLCLRSGVKTNVKESVPGLNQTSSWLPLGWLVGVKGSDHLFWSLNWVYIAKNLSLAETFPFDVFLNKKLRLSIIPVLSPKLQHFDPLFLVGTIGMTENTKEQLTVACC